MISYTDNIRIAGRNHKWVQNALLTTVVMFCRKGPKKNLEKTKAIVFTPGFIWGEWGGGGVQAMGDRRSSNVSREEEIAGKLHRVRSDGVTIFSQKSHGKPTWNLRPPDEGG